MSELIDLKARLFDTEEALKIAQNNFEALVGYLIRALDIPSENLDHFIEQLREKLGDVDEEFAEDEQSQE